MAKNVQMSDVSGLTKSAILLIALGPEKSAKIFKHLKEEEIEQLTLEIANTRSVSPQTKEDVIPFIPSVDNIRIWSKEFFISITKNLK